MFREDKVTQMAARFLQLAGSRIPYTRLLKWLYLADKQMLIEWGKPIVYDRWVAMKYGPVLSATYNLIKGEGKPSYWSCHIETENYEVVLKSDPGSDDLSRAEDRIIEEVFEKYKDHNRSDTIDVVPQIHGWEEPGNTSKEITYETVLQVEGLPDEAIEDILDNINVQNDVELALGTR